MERGKTGGERQERRSGKTTTDGKRDRRTFGVRGSAFVFLCEGVCALDDVFVFQQETAVVKHFWQCSMLPPFICDLLCFLAKTISPTSTLRASASHVCERASDR